MRIALLADGASIHTVKWANALAERNHQVDLLTIRPQKDPLHGRVRVHLLPFASPLGYFTNVLRVRRILRSVQPDVLNAHFASGYGTLGRLSGWHPYVLSVWGRDVYEFPYRSWLHAKIIRGNLRSADHVCSISRVMAAQTKTLCDDIGALSVTPFGVDCRQFQPEGEDTHASDALVIGTVKTLSRKYGIDVLLRAFAMARTQMERTAPDVAARLRLLIVGEGPEKDQLQRLCQDLGISAVTEFTGAVPHGEVPSYLNRLDVYAAMSRFDSESFGVAIVEASACERPVVVSDAGGLPEVVEASVTGFIVERENVEATAAALLKLIEDPALRRRMGKAGRERVLTHYEWSANVKQMEDVYEQVLRQASERPA